MLRRVFSFRTLKEEGKMLTGYISYWNAQRGFGFVQGDDGTRFFVHISQIVDANRVADNVREGDAVTYEAGNGRDGKACALNVRRV
jgi:cold shock protein